MNYLKNIIINHKKSLLILAMTFFLGAKCNKNGSRPCYMSTPYNFKVTSTFSPQKETYSLGDTIYLTSSFPKILTNTTSGQQVDYSNSLGVGGNLNFGKMDSLTQDFSNARNKFSVNVSIGSIEYVDPTWTNILWKENDNNYEFKASIVLLEKGLFILAIPDLGSQGLRGKNCTNANFGMTVANSNKNLNLFYNAIGYSPDALFTKGSYCFRVE
ncbi:MAG: hypothetical protein ACOVNR_08425 [Chitinophagaceae bacterium]